MISNIGLRRARCAYAAWALAMAACFVIAKTAHADPALEETIALHMARGQYNEDSAERKLKEWGAECVPILIKMLREDSSNSDKVSFYLGKTKSSDGVQPLIDYVERLLSNGTRVRFAYSALGWIGDEEALKYLALAAKNPSTSERAIEGLAGSESRQALEILEDLDRSLDGAQPEELAYSLARLRKDIERNEGLKRARDLSEDNSAQRLKFWEFQTSKLSKEPAKEIIGNYLGTAYRESRGGTGKIENVRIIFREDGSFLTNLALLTSMDNSRSGRETELLTDPTQGKYRVLSPTQLIMAPGDRVTTHGFSLGDGQLSFYHRRARAFFVLSKKKIPAPSFTGKDIAGVYKGSAIIAEEGSKALRLVPDVEIVFSDNGYFETNFGNNYGKLLLGVSSVRGQYQIDKSGKLVCFSEFHGGDFFGGDAVSFFDWRVRNGILHANYFQGAYSSCALILSLSADDINPRDPEALDILANGVYTGSAFRVRPGGRITEIPGIELKFSKNGIYRGIPSKKLRPGQQYYPANSGPFAILSDRHLYMGNKWLGDDLNSAGVCDVLVTDDALYFTSISRRAYFALKKKAQ